MQAVRRQRWRRGGSGLPWRDGWPWRQGLLITTGLFTTDAKSEATRDGAPPLDLIDGKRLCDLLKRYDLGVRTKTRTVEEVEVLPEFFADI